ncbi:drug/metabolite transporter (DMT)-like permease [Roseovarius halotolerans]|uniref:EamA-like transporter family protein n=1 Tax=Roseovarius halotolerans TaxID=505353 RepID=A0A1X6YYL5_9RHOB|nr:DMT family transporter [Roseovarius halotolerans]RKT32600.1 drug/metabolite transporter (DMT)-like permease [Roseovarius halotolerans]SLN34911.1 EamA-like transporter family protein [Roseovarius halotolerans]
MNDHVKGLLITAIGVLFVVPDSLFIRLIDASAPTVTFWRGMTSGSFILVGVLAVMGLRGFREVAKTGMPGLIYTILIAATAPGFVLAVTWTSVANVVFIIASMPVFAAIFSRIFLGETISRRMVLTMMGVFVGLGIIAWGSGETEGASWQGDLVAVCVSASFAAAMTAVRKVRATSMIPAIPLAYIGAALVVWPFADPGVVLPDQWHLVVGHGAFITVSTCLLTLGPRYIASAEVALLILLESVLAPLLVWAVIGEDPGPWALAGGAVVIGVLFVSNIWVLRYRRRMRNVPQPRVGPPVE